MKKYILLFLLLSSFSFSIVDFNGVNWGDNENNLNLIFPSLEKEASIDENISILSFKNPKEDIREYQFFLQDNSLNKIRVVFDKETIGKRELQSIYQQLLKKFGSPVLKLPIYKNIDNLKIQGNALKFIPNTSTIIYFTGIDTIDELDKMIDSNLYLDYIPSQNEYSF